MENVPVSKEENDTGKSNFLVKAWRGQEDLAFVWWEMGVPFGIVSYCLKSSWTFKNLYKENLLIYSSAVIAVALAYFIFALMVWRCSPNVQDKGWKSVARGITILGVFIQLLVVIGVVTNFAT